MTANSSRSVAKRGRRNNILDGFISEAEFAEQRGVSIRTCQRDRALRQSPPFVTIGRRVYYRLAAVEAWLLHREKFSVERK